MRSNERRLARHIFSPASFLFVVLIAAVGLFAQPKQPQTPARMMLSVTVVSVRPEMVNDFQNLIKNEYNPGIIKGGAKECSVWQTAAFGSAFEYVFVVPIEKLSQYDGPSPLMKGLGSDGAAAFFAKAGKMVTSVRTFAIEEKPELSFSTNMSGPPKMAVVAHVQVAPGRNAEYENFIKNEWMPLVKQAGIAGYWVNQVVFGGNVNEYVTVTVMDSFADVEKGPPPARVIGMDGLAKLMQKLPAGTIVNLERYVSKYNADLSIMPAPTKQ